MLKVVALTGGVNLGSSRFRVRQYIPKLEQCGVNIIEYPSAISTYAQPVIGGYNLKYIPPVYPGVVIAKALSRLPGIISSYSADACWLERGFCPGLVTLEPCLKKPIVFDIDDAIWFHKPFGEAAVRCFAKKSEIIMAGNAYLANWISKYNKRVKVIPTAVDTDLFLVKDYNKKDSEKFVVGWIGSSAGYKYLESIERELLIFAQQHKNIEFLIIADKPPHFNDLNKYARFLPWSKEIEVSAIHAMDVGIMPLLDTEWEHGKCSFKMLQYMSCGLPVVVSAVGMNVDVLARGNVGLGVVKNQEWADALTLLYNNPAMCLEMGKNGRLVIEQFYSVSKVTKDIADIFKNL
jgi:glycosyltransferase involved in cell wall biosynthesis